MKIKFLTTLLLLGFSTAALADAKVFFPDGAEFPALTIENQTGAKSAGIMHVRLLDPTDPKWDPTLPSDTNCEALLSFHGINAVAGIVNSEGVQIHSCTELFNATFGADGFSWFIVTPSSEFGCPANTVGVILSLGLGQGEQNALRGGSQPCGSNFAPLPLIGFPKNVIPSGLVLLNAEK